LTIAAPTYTTTPFSCSETVAYTAEQQSTTTLPSFVTFDTSTRVVTISTNDATLVGPIYLRIKITRSQSNVTANLDFTLILVNPCSSATLNTSALTITAMTVNIGLSTTSSSYTMTDSVNASNSNINCGNRTFSIWNSSGSTQVTWISVTGVTSFTITAAPNADNLYSASA